MKRLFTLLLFILGANPAAFAADDARPEIARYVKAYSGQAGITVWTLRVGPAAKNEALLQITGVDHAWDMRIQKAKTEPTARGTNYVAMVDGKRFVVLMLEGTHGELYLPGSNDPKARVGYNKSMSEAGNAEHFLTDYLQQK